ncbi:MAG: phosphoadenylyl-sulfate reductase [Kiritimatiellia bacterium]
MIALLARMQNIDPHDAAAILRETIDLYDDRVVMATSFQLGGLVLLDMVHRLEKHIRIFSLDTGRLPEETYQCAEQVRLRYGINVEWVFPRHEAVEQLEREKGMYSFRESVENRQECCGIRKVEPLRRALAGADAWITGRRSDQGESRKEISLVEDDPVQPGRLKVNPLLHWSKVELWEYCQRHNVPYNRLYDKGYLSIGCECCTRPCQEGEDERAGRWWWESPELHKECGLHFTRGDGI